MKKLIFLALLLKTSFAQADLPSLPDFGSNNNPEIPQKPKPIEEKEEAPEHLLPLKPVLTPKQMQTPEDKVEVPHLEDFLDEKDTPKLPEIPEEEPKIELSQPTPPENLLPIPPQLPQRPIEIPIEQPKSPEAAIIPSPAVEEKKDDPFKPKNLIPITPNATIKKAPEIVTPGIQALPEPVVPDKLPDVVAPQQPRTQIPTNHEPSTTQQQPAPAQNLLPITQPSSAPEPSKQAQNLPIQEKVEIKPESTQEESYDSTEDVFVKRELKVFTLPNDDMILGQITEEAEIENMDLPKYAKLYKQVMLTEPKKNSTDKANKFIKNVKTKTQRKIDPDSVKMMMDNNPEFAISFSRDEVSYLTIFAAKNGDLELLRLMIDNYYSLDIVDEIGNSLLMIATMNNKDKIVAYLLRKGIDPNIANMENQTPLSVASKNHHHNIIKMLKEAGAFGDVDPSDLEISEDFNVKF
jgi:hypothetical protein